jgi:hypothetical protein
MRKILVVVSLLLPTAQLFPQLIQARFVSSAYGWKQQDTVGQSTDHFFGYQAIQFSATKENFSLHTYWQGYNDFAGPFAGKAQYRVYNLYARATNLFNLIDVSLGRQAVFAGAGNGTIDGGLAALKLFDSQLKLVGYYGSLPPPQQKATLISNAGNNFMAGAQLVAMPADYVQFSLSYMKRAIQPDVYTATRRDSLFNPYLVEIRPSAREEKSISGDVNIDYEDWITFYGRYDYDMLSKKGSRTNFFTRVKPRESLGITAEYLQRDPRISFNSIFSAFTFTTLKEYQFGLEYALSDEWQLFGRYGNVDYDGESVSSVTLGANSKLVSASLSRNAGYPGNLTAASVNLGYPLMDNTVTPTLMVSYAQYKLNENSSLDGALSIGLGAVYRPMPELSLDCQFQWIQNKIYKNDSRLFVRLSYVFLQRLDLF